MKDAKWTTKDIPDLTDKIIVITGGNSGLGFESAKALAPKGAHVIIACRSVEKGEEAKKQIQDQGSGGKIEVMELDLMALDSVKNFVDQFKKNYNRLDVLMNNAGIMMAPYGLTRDGFESQMGINHLGHFALTGLLMDLIVKTPDSRVVNVSSNAHKQGKMDFDNLLFENGKGYSPMKAYGRSKLANLLFTYELQRRFEEKGVDSIAVAAHPGASETNLTRYLKGTLLYKILYPVASFIMQDAAMGALPQLRASVDPDVKGGEYYGPEGFREFYGYPELVEANPAAYNKDDARKLWELSEELTGLSYRF